MLTIKNQNQIENEIIDVLLTGKDLGVTQTRKAFEQLFKNKTAEPLGYAGQLLVLLQKKGESINEIFALAKLLREKEKKINIGETSIIDGCGTGGDQSNTFNISTLACLVASGAGAKIVKHGNRSISSKCGSSDLLEAFGVNLHAGVKKMSKSLKKAGFAYFHAPDYHPLFAQIQATRKAIGKKGAKTIFNLIGPLSNPARPKRQVIGLFRQDYVPVVAEVMKKLGFSHAIVFSSNRNMDEITPFAKTFVNEIKNKKIEAYFLDATTLKNDSMNNLKGGNTNRNKQIAKNILNGKDKTVRRDTVILNAAVILYVAGKAETIAEGIQKASQAINNGNAFRVLAQLARISHDS